MGWLFLKTPVLHVSSARNWSSRDSSVFGRRSRGEIWRVTRPADRTNVPKTMCPIWDSFGPTRPELEASLRRSREDRGWSQKATMTVPSVQITERDTICGLLGAGNLQLRRVDESRGAVKLSSATPLDRRCFRPVQAVIVNPPMKNGAPCQPAGRCCLARITISCPRHASPVAEEPCESLDLPASPTTRPCRLGFFAGIFRNDVNAGG